MKFTGDSLEQAVIELFKAENYQHVNGMYLHKEIREVRTFRKYTISQ